MVTIVSRLTSTGTLFVNGSFDEITLVAGGSSSNSTLYTTTGTATFSVPAGITSLTVEAWGGGGGSINADNALGAGAGGAYASSAVTVSPLSTVYLFVGSGGGGGSVGNAGTNSWVNTSTNLAPSSSSTGVVAVGGAGAPVTSPNNSTQRANSVGQVINIGGAGGSGIAEPGGGASGSKFGAGGAGLNNVTGSNGGASPGAGAGGLGSAATDGSDGISNVEGGGGGGGSYNNVGGMGGIPGGAGGPGYGTGHTAPTVGVNTNPHTYGGNGGRGQVRITYTVASGATTTLNRVSTDTIYAGGFDEVTVNPNSAVITNLWSYSQSFTSTGWSTIGSTIVLSTATTAPDGSNTAYKLIGTLSTTSGFVGVSQAFNGQSTATIASIYAKAAEKTSVYWSPAQGGFAHFNLSNGTVISYDFGPRTGTSLGFSGASISPVGNGWYRCSATLFPDSANLISPLYFGADTGTSTTTWAGDGVSGVYMWGAQIEYTVSTSTFTPSMYVATTASRAISKTNGIQKLASNGTSYIAGNYDEFTGAGVVDSSLILWVDAGQPASYPGSGTTWTDLSGNGANYTVPAGTFSSNNGGGFNLTTSVQLTSLSTLNVNAGSHTVSVWINQTFADSRIQRWITIGTGNDDIVLRYNGVGAIGQLQYYMTLNSVIDAGDLKINSQVTAGQTANFVGTYDGSTIRAYKNGVIIGSAGVSGVFSGIGVNYKLGASSATEGFTGTVYQSQVYNRALSSDEILQNYNALRRRYGL